MSDALAVIQVVLEALSLAVAVLSFIKADLPPGDRSESASEDTQPRREER